LKSEVNKNKLLKAIENVKEGQNLVEVNLHNLQ
jgi:antitoxin YefM